MPQPDWYSTPPPLEHGDSIVALHYITAAKHARAAANAVLSSNTVAGVVLVEVLQVLH